jgi:inner membrane protein
MPTAMTHVFVSLAVGKAAVRGKPPFGLGWLMMGLAVLPDLDTLGLGWGVPYASFWGHRGVMHSLAFAVVVALLATWLAGGWLRPTFRTRWRLALVLLAVTVTHPLLDAMTDGGLGIALLAPFDNTRYFLPWQPIKVSPIGLRAFLSPYGLEVILNELLCVWLPATLATVAVRVVRWRLSPKAETP